jgi:hypothetical protein
VFDEFIAKGVEYGHKFCRTLANRVDERRNMINDYLRRRACIESVRGVDFRGSVDFELLLWFLAFLALFVILSLFLPFVGFYGFPSSR